MFALFLVMLALGSVPVTMHAVAVSTEDPDAFAVRVAVPVGVFVGALLLLAASFPILAIPSSIARAELQRRFPDAIVVAVSYGVWSRESVDQLRGGGSLKFSQQITVNLTAEELGISLWTGARAPERVAFASWSDMAELRVVEKEHLGRTLGALTLVLANGQLLPMSLTEENWTRPFHVAGRGELEALKERLERLRRPGQPDSL